MNRRDFLRAAALASAAGISVSRYGWSQEMDYDGPLLLTVMAPGGWDPTLLCDPKGSLGPSDREPMNRTYSADDIRSPSQSSPITWAPLGSNDDFFGRHYDKLLIFNGVDVQTNNHELGAQFVSCGSIIDRMPSISALLAATRGQELALSYQVYGSYDVTGGLIPRTRIGRAASLANVIYPNRNQFDQPLIHPTDLDSVIAFSRRRAAAELESQRLPRLQRNLDAFIKTRTAQGSLESLSEFLPDLNQFQTNVAQQGALVLASYQAGLTAAATISIRANFDSHDNNDNNQTTSLGVLTRGITELWQEIERVGLEDRVVFFIVSDLGRTPNYNPGEGKDHWPITSMMMMGAGIEGNRVIGASSHRQNRLSVSPDTFTAVEDPEDGVILTPGHVHIALRELLGIADHPFCQLHEIDLPILPFFS